MKLTIDTKLDSKEEIRKAIKLLMGIVGGAHEVYSNELPEGPKPISPPNIFENPPNNGSNFMNIFDVPTPTEAPQTTTLSPQPEEQKDDDIPSLEFY
jgi:hypothetical protein